MREDKKPLVSVLMSVYNAEPTLPKAIESILNQTEEDFEFVICDDGSSDRSWDIISGYSAGSEKIQAFRNEKNLGLAASLNHCLRLASGEYIARQDADDISSPDRLEKTLAYLRKNDCPYAGCGVCIFDDTSIWSKRMFPEVITKHMIAQYNPFFHPTMIFKRAIIASADGYRVAKETRRTEDYDLVMRLAAEGVIGKNLQECLYYVYEPADAYRKHTFQTRWYEICVRIYGLRKMKAPLRDYIYLMKPMILCAIPRCFMRTLKQWQWKIKAKIRSPHKLW
jgi:glycosyltransferase EpsE